VDQPQPEYIYPGQWMDELGSASLVASQAPRVATDMYYGIPNRDAFNSIAGNLFGSQTNPYQG
jgi:hypothetical protein